MMPTGPGAWFRDDGDPKQPVRVTADLYWRRDYERVCRPVTDDGHWLAPVLTPSEVSALTERAERAERERDELRATLDAVAALVGGGDVVERVRELAAADAALRAAGVLR